jgi:hypothetical protein
VVEHIQVRSKQEAAMLRCNTAQIDRLQSGSTYYTKQLAYRFAVLNGYNAEK